MAIEDIERLKEKVNKDPNSKLFILLAEEYKNAGMFDEAINVLTEGIEKQPGYMSARVSLGKIYLERGMLDKARVGFEKVVHTIPENLYAHKKLAEIYRDLGERDRAVEEFKEVLKLNPFDEWALTNLADIEKAYQLQPEAQAIEKFEEKPQAEQEPSIGIEEEELSKISLSEEDIDDFGKTYSKTGDSVEMVEEIEEFKALRKAQEPLQKESLSFDNMLKESEDAIEEKDKAVPFLSLADADSYIFNGKYIAAIDIYKKLLSIEPNNMQVMQRIEELKALLKLLGEDKEALITRLDSLFNGIKNGKNKEALIARLDNLLNGINKRRDEFFRSP
jgi:tetratricopeptide (TPR) repeat protein